MKTCKQCKDDACPEMGVDMPGCEDFTSKAIEEEPVEWAPTLEDYNSLKQLYMDTLDELIEEQARVVGLESAVADLVKWAQDEQP